MKITLSFDNGPYPEVTPWVLDTLSMHGIKSTFFVIGSLIENPIGANLIRDAHREGHQLGNHTYSHSFLFGEEKDQQKVLWEIDRTQELLGELGSKKLFRPFGGNREMGEHLMSRTAYEHLKSNGYSCVLWNSIPEDWLNPTGWADTALRHASETDWVVTVVHDIPTGAMKTLRDFIVRATDEGAEFVQDFPSSVTPLWKGEELWDMSKYVSTH